MKYILSLLILIVCLFFLVSALILMLPIYLWDFNQDRWFEYTRKIVAPVFNISFVGKGINFAQETLKMDYW